MLTSILRGHSNDTSPISHLQLLSSRPGGVAAVGVVSVPREQHASPGKVPAVEPVPSPPKVLSFPSREFSAPRASTPTDLTPSDNGDDNDVSFDYQNVSDLKPRSNSKSNNEPPMEAASPKPRLAPVSPGNDGSVIEESFDSYLR